MDKPKIHSDIYVPTSCYIGHGKDDVQGGAAQVIKVEKGVSAGKKVWFVEVLEHPGHSYNWPNLAKDQKKLKREFGKKRAYPDPDYHIYD